MSFFFSDGEFVFVETDACFERKSESMTMSPTETSSQTQKLADAKISEVTDEREPLLTSKVECCSSCGMRGGLKTCKGCHTQKYCSVECQVADWKSHKSQCQKEKSTDKKPKQDDEALPICAHCKVKNTSLVCERCRCVFYCSKPCQTADWKTHIKACRRRSNKQNVTETLSVQFCTLYGLVSPEENRGVDLNDVHAHESDRGITPKQEYLCCLCKINPSVITCPECKSSAYCSTRCMYKDRGKHKAICNTLQASQQYGGPSPNATSLILGSSDRSVCYAPSHSPLSLFFDPLTVQDGADLSLIVERSVASCERAREKTRHRFPSHTLITRIREIPIEQTTLNATNICTLPYVFVSYIRRFHGYRGRHNVYLQVNTTTRGR